MVTTDSEASPYLSGNYAPVHDEADVVNLEVVGNLPRDLRGTFLRNSSNPRFPAPGPYHWFDGDGMVHAVALGGGDATYRNRWVRTAGYQAESAAGHALWSGLSDTQRRPGMRPGLKNTANTDLVWHGGQLLALWWLSGEAYVLNLPSLATVGTQSYGGQMPHFSAHPKVDPLTGEMVVFDYKPFPPYMTYGLIDAAGKLVHKTTIDLPGPRLQHDIAITATYTLFFDFSLQWDADDLARGRTRAIFRRDQPTRIGLLPRHAAGSQVRWIEVKPCFQYHTINAWDEGDDVVLIGCRIDQPLAGAAYQSPSPRGVAPLVPEIGYLRIEPCLYRWRLNWQRGLVAEERLDERLVEFPRINPRRLGQPSRFAYLPTLAPAATVMFDGVRKYDLQTGAATDLRYPAGHYGGEVVFAPRSGEGAEDRGYLLTFVVEEATGKSELWVIDAENPASGPLAKVKILRRVPAGFHAWWVDGAEASLA